MGRTAQLTGPAWLLLVLACSSPPAVSTSGGLTVVKTGQQRLDASGRAGRVGRPYFAAGGGLRWDDSPQDPVPACPPETRQTERVTLMLNPRVDRARCAGGSGARPTALLLGIDEAGKVSWRRPLGFASGQFTLDEEVIGASPDGVVLGDLAVIAPGSGLPLREPPTHLVEGRPVPDHDLTGAALFLPERGAFLWFSADVTLLERKGGLFLVDAASGRRDLVLPVAASFTGGFWRVEEMTRAPDGRHVLLAERFAARGPGGVAIAVFDPERRELAYRERFEPGGFCEDAQVVSAPGGLFGLAYLDATAGKRVLVRYQMREPA